MPVPYFRGRGTHEMALFPDTSFDTAGGYDGLLCDRCDRCRISAAQDKAGIASGGMCPKTRGRLPVSNMSACPIDIPAENLLSRYDGVSEMKCTLQKVVVKRILLP